MLIFNIGFDIATQKTGIAMVIQEPNKERKVIYSGLLVLDKKSNFGGDKGSLDAINIAIEMQKLSQTIATFTKDLKKEEVQINIAYERSSHGFRSVAEKLSVYVGMFQGILSAQLAGYDISALQGNIHQKYVSPNQWGLRTIGEKYTSAKKDKAGDRKRKKWAIDFANKVSNTNAFKYEMIGKGHDDIADAVNIAWVADELVDSTEATKAKQKRKLDNFKNHKTIARTKAYLNNLKEGALDKKFKKVSKNPELKDEHWTKFLTTKLEKENYKKWVQALLDAKASNKEIAEYAIKREQ